MHPARFVPALIVGGIMVVAVAACSAGSQPGWTFAPTPTPTVAPSTAPSASAGTPSSSAAPSAPASSVPSAGASGAASNAPSAAASSATGGTVLAEVASGIAFKTTTFQAPANQPFQITYDNQDAGIPHNMQIADSTGKFVFEGDTVTGVAQITYNVPPLAAGAYKFSCKYHTNMVGDLTVQ